MRSLGTIGPAVSRLVVIAATVCAFAAPALASAPLIIMPGDEHLRPGSLITVRWDGLPPRVEELEFFLIRGGEREEIVRLTPQLVPSSGSFRWRVPNLPSNAAFLRLRIRITDVGAMNVADSAIFRIASAWRREDALVFRDGQWWISPMESAAVPRSFEEEFALAIPDAEAVITESKSRGESPLVPAFLPFAERAAASAGPTLAALSRAPLVVPQRK